MSDYGKSFLLVPNELIYKGNEYELITYIILSMNRHLFDVKNVKTSIIDICQTAGYSYVDRHDGSYFTCIRKILEQFDKRGWIKLHYPSEKKINPSELIQIRLNDFFFPQKKYTSVVTEDLYTIFKNGNYKNKAALIRVFLYIKSFMQVVYEGRTDCTISAYYVSGNVAAYALNMSRGKYDICIKTLCNTGLIICHQTGSYFNEFGIANAPNIYVLNNEDADRNIRGAINRLRYKLLDDRYGNHEDFMPTTYTGKAFTDDEDYGYGYDYDYNDIVTDRVNSQDNNDDDGEWGDPNPMSQRSW